MPTPFEANIATHIAAFIAMLDEAFRRYGVSEGLPARLRDAVATTPRRTSWRSVWRWGKCPCNGSRPCGGVGACP